MMKLRHFISYVALATLAAGAIACSGDDEKWQPGPAVKEGCQQVRFSSENPSLALASSNGLELIVKRSTTEGALTVPVRIISATEGMTIPSQVVFNDGDEVATLSISVPESASSGDNFDYALALEGEEVDPYADVDGSIYFRGRISFATLRHAQMYADGFTNLLGWWPEEVYDLGTGDYVIENFCGSGYGVRISVDASNYAVVTPYNSDLYATSYDYGSFLYLTYTTANGYTNAYPWGKDFPVYLSTLNIFNGSGEYKGYGRYYPATDRFLITAGSLTVNSNGVETTGSYVYMYLKLYPVGEEAVISRPDINDKPGE